MNNIIENSKEVNNTVSNNYNDLIIKDPVVIDKLIKEFEPKIFKTYCKEEDRCEHVDRQEEFQYVDFLKDFKVPSRSDKNKEYKLMTYLYLPNNNLFKEPKGLVYMLHGMGAYSGNTAHVAKHYADVGCIVATYDYRGHGLSEGINGNIEKIEYVLKDTVDFMKATEQYLESKYKNIKENLHFFKNTFITGISMGGFLSYYLTYNKDYIKQDVKGVIFYAPAIEVHANYLLKKVLASASWLFPNFPLPKNKKEIDYCRNLNYLDQPHPVISKVTVKCRTANEIVSNTQFIQDNCKNYSCSFLMVAPGVDKLCTPKSMLNFYNESISKDKEIFYCHNLWHAVYIEKEINELMLEVKEWIKKRL